MGKNESLLIYPGGTNNLPTQPPRKEGGSTVGPLDTRGGGGTDGSGECLKGRHTREVQPVPGLEGGFQIF